MKTDSGERGFEKPIRTSLEANREYAMGGFRNPSDGDPIFLTPGKCA